MNSRKWIDPIDPVIWSLVMVFFMSFSVFNNGSALKAFMASMGIIALMTAIGFSIEVIIESLKNIRSLGTVMGFITNGPELVVLVVGILARDPLFGVSTPLGSNVINPIMLFASAIITGLLLKVIKVGGSYTIFCIITTLLLTLSFYLIPSEIFPIWILVAIGLSVFLFVNKPKEGKDKDVKAEASRFFIIPAILILISAGYFLDPQVEYAARVSNVPKNLIGFLVLATLSSWPEFKSCYSFFKRGRVRSAGMNIFASNISNVWLAVIGILFYLFF